MKRDLPRIDELLLQKGLAPSISKAQGLVLAGQVYVEGLRVDKAGTRIDPEKTIDINLGSPYVSRGGEKLAAAIAQFSLDLSGKVCADIGSSTGGFTDALLQAGAARVYAIDVAHNELDWKLRNDPRVVVMEGKDIRKVESLPEKVDFLSIDVSLLSVTKIFPKVIELVREGGEIVILIKPQYEAKKEQLPPGAVIQDPELHREILREVLDYLTRGKLKLMGLTTSPIKGRSGNTEFLAYLAR